MLRQYTIALFLLAGLAAGSAFATGAARAALKKNKYGGQNGKIEEWQKKGGGGKTHGGGAGSYDDIPKDERIGWYTNEPEVFEAAGKDKSPVVLYFPAEELDLMDASVELHGKDVAKVSEDSALFVMVPYNADRTPGFDDGSPVPTSKFLSPNLARDYAVTKNPTFVICDWHGNEYQRWTKVPTEKDMIKQIESIAAEMEKLDKKLTVTLDEAKKAKDAKDLREFFKVADKNFKTGAVGLAAAEETIKLYREVIDAGRDEVNKILETKPADGQAQLKEMAKTYRDTDLAEEIDEALDVLKG